MNNHVVSLSSGFVEEITDAIKTDLNLETNPILLFKVIYDDDRRIYKISIENSKQFYVLKIRGIRVVKQQDHDLADLQNEYDLLVSAWQFAKSLKDGFSMSKPVKLWLEQKSMLMSGCEGENLNDFFNQNIMKWTFNISDLKTRIHHCGFWLGNYHQLATEVKPLEEVIVQRNSHLERMLKVLRRKNGHQLKEKDLLMVSTHFQKLASQTGSLFESEEAEKVMGNLGQIHGNFAYRNVLSDNNITNLVDFEDARVDYVGYDIGQFLAEIILKSQFPWLRGISRTLIQAFNSGYQSHLNYQQNLVEAYTGYHLIVHLYEHCSRKQPSFPKSIIHRYRINYLSKQVKKWFKHNLTSFD